MPPGPLCRRSSGVLFRAALLLAVGAAPLTACSSSSSSAEPTGTSTTAALASTAAVPLGMVTQASLSVPVGATTIAVAIGPSNGPLIAVRTPLTAGAQPLLQAVPPAVSSTTTHVVVGLHAGPGGPAVHSTTALTILLNPKVAWSVTLTGGATRESVNGLNGHLSRIQLGKTSLATVALPAVAGATVVREVGGVSELDITTPRNEVASVLATAGAGTITIDGVSHTGIAAGTTIAQPGYANAADQLDVRLQAGASRVTVSPT